MKIILSLFLVFANLDSAFAQDSASQPSAAASFLPLIAVFFVFYFLIMRPQQKRYKNHQEMLKNLKKGDQVMTAGGIIGKVTKIDANEDVIYVEIAESVTIKVLRTTISNIYNSTSASEVVRKEKVKKAPVANDN
jgi:preprotein translocase subunit YajC